ncbi:MAG: c-type cytochrome, partial [Planctomycetaceae bacterium]|nr:c-type cytochrome [Planctomycetaceae bacterium]
HQPREQWKQKALDESDTTTALAAMMALARAPHSNSEKPILAKLNSLPLEKWTESQKLMVLDTFRLCLQHDYDLTPAERDGISRSLAPLFPTASQNLNLKMTQVLAHVGVPDLVPKVMSWLPQVHEQSLRLHGLFILRDVQLGWTPALRDDYFSALLTMREFQGGEGMPTFVRRVESDALAALNDSLRSKYQGRLERKEAQEPLATPNRPKVQDWKLEDFENDLPHVAGRRNFEHGKKLFREALCIRCHRVGFEGAAVGPDLTSVGRRFSRRDLLASILSPSKVVAEQYRQTKIVTTKGETYAGQIIPARDYGSPNLQIATNPLEPYKVTEVLKSEIESHQTSETSVMPEDLLDRFTKTEILELIAWLEAGGNPNHPNYR